MPALSTMMWNVRSLMDSHTKKGQKKRKFLRAFNNNHHPDILILLETWKTREETESFFSYLGPFFQTLSTTLDPLVESRKRGVAIIFDTRKVRLAEGTIPKISKEGWYILADFIEIASNTPFSVTALYTPSKENSGREKFFENFFKEAPPVNDLHFMYGDFNMVSDARRDTRNTQKSPPLSLVQTFENGIDRWSLSEPLDEITSSTMMWWKSYKLSTATQKRLDRVYCTPCALPKISAPRADFNPRISDHAPVSAKISFGEDLPRPTIFSFQKKNSTKKWLRQQI